jgi:hypothetical protein
MARTVIPRICQICSKEFNARPSQVKIGNGRFCSRTCRGLGQPRESLEKRFWDKVDKSKGIEACWEWTASRNADGYGMIGIGKGSSKGAHRVSYLLNNGIIPDGYKVLHRCDNPSCCNPSHLFLGTQADNVADMVRKKRNVSHKGEKASGAKLTREEASAIRRDPASRQGVSKVELAKRYNVRIQTIYNVLNDKTYQSTTSLDMP